MKIPGQISVAINNQAIVSQELFDAVQAKLAERTNPRSPTPSRKIVSLLAGMIRDHRRRPMSPSHANNHGRRYRYYVSNINDDAGTPVLRLPAGELEAAVRHELASYLLNTDRTRELANGASTDALRSFVQLCSQLGQRIATASSAELKATLGDIGFAVLVEPARITASFSCASLLEQAGAMNPDAPRPVISIATLQVSHGHELRLRLDAQAGIPNPADQRLIEVVARGFAARDELITMSEDELAAIPVTKLRHLQRIARLSYLDPSLVRSILDGSQPSSLSARELWRQDSLPLSWMEQRRTLGVPLG